MPRLEFTTGQVLTAGEMNDLSDQSVMVFDDAAARTTAIPTPSEGMVTYLKDDDQVTVFDGSAFVGVGGGKILQVVSTVKTDTFTTTSATFVDVTGVSATITPTSASSKIFVTVSGFGNVSVGDRPGYLRLLRDSTAIGIGDQFSSNTNWVRASAAINSSGGAPDINGEAFGFSFLDSPATSSSTTYKIQARVGEATPGTFAIGRPNSTAANDSNRWTCPTSITVMEVAG